VTEQGYKMSEAAGTLDLHVNVLRKWKRAMEANGSTAFPGQGRQSPEQEELPRLRQENQRLQMEPF
jgi:transposase